MAVFQGFRTASRTLSDAPHRDSARSLPKTLENRLYGSLLMQLGINMETQTIRLLSASYILSVPMLRPFWQEFWPSTVVAWSMLPVLFYLSLRFFSATGRLENLRAGLMLTLVAGLTGLSAHAPTITIYGLALVVIWLVRWRCWAPKLIYVLMAAAGAAALVQVRVLPMVVYFREFPDGLDRPRVYTGFLGDFVWGMIFRPLVWPPQAEFPALLANLQFPQAAAMFFDQYLVRHLDVQASFLGPVLMLLGVVAITSRAFKHSYRGPLTVAVIFSAIAMLVPTSVSWNVFNVRFFWADSITFLLLLLAGITLSALARDFGAEGQRLAMVTRRAQIVVLALGIFPSIFLASSLILRAETGLATKLFDGLPQIGRTGVVNMKEMANSSLAGRIKAISGHAGPRVYLSPGVGSGKLIGMPGDQPGRAAVPLEGGLALSGLRVVTSSSKGFSQGAFYPEQALPYSSISPQASLLSRPAALDVLGINVVVAFPDELNDDSLNFKEWVSLADGRRFGIYINSDAWKPATVVSPRIGTLKPDLVPDCEHQRLLCRDLSRLLELSDVHTPVEAKYREGEVRVTLAAGDTARTLFVSEAYRPGWQALAETGEQLTVTPVLDAFLTVRVPAQVKSITLSYRPAWRERSFYVFAISLVALLFALLGVALYGRRTTAP